jgi:uncharacterized protein (DUF1919 family)
MFVNISHPFLFVTLFMNIYLNVQALIHLKFLKEVGYFLEIGLERENLKPYMTKGSFQKFDLIKSSKSNGHLKKVRLTKGQRIKRKSIFVSYSRSLILQKDNKHC